MSPSSIQVIRYCKVFLLLILLSASVGLIPTFWKVTHATLEASPRENELDQQTFTEAKTTYQTTVKQVIESANPARCNSLPELVLPYHRSQGGSIQYVKSQSDGPIVPARESYWPRKQCLYAYVISQGMSRCDEVFSIAEEQQDCRAEFLSPPINQHRVLEPLTTESEKHLGKKYFQSTSSKQALPYYLLYPDKPVQGILIYLHGAGGGLEQGQLDGTYKDSFKKLKTLLKTDLSYLYVTPSLSNYRADGGQDAADLAKELQSRYPNVPIYLAGASAGGRTLFYALKHAPQLFQGAIALCPAIDSTIANTDWSREAQVPLWISQGTHDQYIPIGIIDDFITRLKQQGRQVIYNRIPDGDHGTPIDEIDWKTVLQQLQTPIP